MVTVNLALDNNTGEIMKFKLLYWFAIIACSVAFWIYWTGKIPTAKHIFR